MAAFDTRTDMDRMEAALRVIGKLLDRAAEWDRQMVG